MLAACTNHTLQLGLETNSEFLQSWTLLFHAVTSISMLI